jgi:hypothetical protein
MLLMRSTEDCRLVSTYATRSQGKGLIGRNCALSLRSLGLESRVTLTGALGEAEVFQLLSRADALFCRVLVLARHDRCRSWKQWALDCQ